MPLDVGIDPRGIVFAIVRSGNLIVIIIGCGESIARQVRIGIPGDDSSGDGIDPAERNSVPRKERSNITAAAIRSRGQWVGNLERGARRVECL